MVLSHLQQAVKSQNSIPQNPCQQPGRSSGMETMSGVFKDEI
jgi:hypothetical protein